MAILKLMAWWIKLVIKSHLNYFENSLFEYNKHYDSLKEIAKNIFIK